MGEMEQRSALYLKKKTTVWFLKMTEAVCPHDPAVNKLQPTITDAWRLLAMMLKN